MQKNRKFYSFLLTHTTKSKIYIRRVEVSKKLLHTGAAGLILTVGVSGLGLLNLPSGSVFAKNAETNAAMVLTAPPVVRVQETPTAPKQIDYSRPAANDSTVNTGGPATPFQLTLVGSDEEEAQIESRIKIIQTTGDAAFVPSMWAHLGKINNEFGFRRNPFGGRTYEFHPGMDIDGEKGDDVLAPANGTVIKAGGQGGYGNMIEIDHGNGLTTRYGHLSKIEVQVGDAIQRGQLIGLIGSTGRSTGPHLHYEIRLNDKAINPRRFLPPEPTDLSKAK